MLGCLFVAFVDKRSLEHAITKLILNRKKTRTTPRTEGFHDWVVRNKKKYMHPSWHEIGRGYVLQIHVGGFQTPDCVINEYPADCQRDKLFWNTGLNLRCRRFDVKRAHVKLKRMYVVLYVALERGKVIHVWVVVSRLISSIMATGVVKVHKTTEGYSDD